MGIKEVLARQRNENRIKLRTKRFDHMQHNTEDELDEAFNNIGNRVYKIGKHVYDTTQSRKAEGKVLFKQTVRHVVGDTARAFLGPRKSSTKSSLFQKKKKPKGKKPWSI